MNVRKNPVAAKGHELFLPSRFIPIAVFALLVVFLAASCAKRYNYGREQYPVRSFSQTMSDLKAQLDLTEKQEAKVRPIIQESFNKRRALLEKLGRIPHDTKVLLSSVLTKEQMVELKKYQAEQRIATRGGGGIRRGGGGGFSGGGRGGFGGGGRGGGGGGGGGGGRGGGGFGR